MTRPTSVQKELIMDKGTKDILLGAVVVAFIVIGIIVGRR